MMKNNIQHNTGTGKPFTPLVYSINIPSEKQMHRKVRKINEIPNIRHPIVQTNQNVIGWTISPDGAHCKCNSMHHIDPIIGMPHKRTREAYDVSETSVKTGTMILIGIVTICALMTATILPTPWSFMSIGFGGPMITLIKRLLK